MPLNANTAPYYDDYDSSNQYYQIMFNPGRPVQARELTQIQSMLQKQIERMGDHIFQHGARVLGGHVSYSRCKFVKLADFEQNDATQPAVDVSAVYDTTTLDGAKVILDPTSAGDYGVDADGNVITPDGRSPIAQIIFAQNRDGTDPATLLLTYETGDEFQANDFITTIASGSFPAKAAVINATPTSTDLAVGDATYVTVANGVYYVKSSTGSHFTYNNKQRIALSKYTNTPTSRVGFNIKETFVTETSDSSLYDNAGGVNQPTAPGAHRLKIDLELGVAAGSDGITIDDSANEDFLELLRVENGIKMFSTLSGDSSSKIYSAIGDAMAERSHDATGNYVVDPFECRVEDTYPVSDQLKVTVQPARGQTSARAYVKGREFEMAGPWTQYIDKARGTAIETELVSSTAVGSYLIVKGLTSHPHIGAEGSSLQTGLLPMWDIHSVNTYNINSATIEEYNSTRIGSFRLRDIKAAGRFGNTATAGLHTMYVQDFKTSNALTGFFSLPVVDVEVGNGAKKVQISLTNRNTSVNAYIGARITLIGSTIAPEFANQTRIIIGSTVSGVLTLDQPFTQPPGNTALFPGEAESYSIVIDPTAAMTGNGSIVPSPYRDHDLAISTVVSEDLNRVKTANANIMRTQQNANTNPFVGGGQPALLFPLSTGGARVANSIASSVTEADIHYIARYNSTTSTGTTSRTFDRDDFREAGGGFSSGTFIEGATENNYSFFNETTGVALSREDIDTFVLTTTSITVTSASSIASSHVIRMIGPILISALPAKKKVLKQGVNTQTSAYPIVTDRTTNGHVLFATPNKIPGIKDNLGAIDVYRIRAVYDTGELTVPPTGAMLATDANDITQHYILNDGQREDMYDYASVELKAGSPGPLGQMVVVYDWFEHTDAATTEGGYFSIDSYHDQVSLDNVPFFVSKTTGFRYNLKDYIDFRPSRAVSTTGVANTSYFVPVRAVSTDSGVPSTGDPIGHIDAAGAFFYYMQYYAARFDKIVIGDRRNTQGANTGTLQIVSGSTTRSPATMPNVSQQDMSLFTLSIPSYTKRPEDVIISKEDNKRYTMSDIGSIRNRVDRLEYFSSMNVIESELSGIKLVDSNGSERYKNGFLVDTFDSGAAASDVGLPGRPNPDFNASVGRGMLRPAVEKDNIELSLEDSTSTNIYHRNGALMLPFTTTTSSPGLSQIKATEGGGENINPFSIQAFYGEMSLSPSSDNWHSTIDLPASSSDRSSARLSTQSQIQSRLDRGEGDTNWGAWEDSWFGEPAVTTSEHFSDAEGAYQAALSTPPAIDPWMDRRVMIHDDAGNFIHSPVDGYDYLSNDAGARPGLRILNSLSGGASSTLPGHPNGIYDYLRVEIVRDNSNPRFNVPGQLRVTDELLQTTVTAGDNHSQRRGTYNQFNLTEEQVLVDDVVLSTITSPYMRPVDIRFRANRMKPRTTVYPMFDNQNVTNYTERANELILINTDLSAYTNPFGDLGPGEEETVSDIASNGIGTAVGTLGNTVFIVSANGVFLEGSTTVGRSRSTTALTKTISKYKSFSGTVQEAPTGTTMQLDDSAMNSWHNTDVAGTLAASIPGGSPDVDLANRKIYIVEGRGYGQSKTIRSYSNTTGVLTVDSAWELTPNTQSRYSLGDHYTSFAGSAYGVFHLPNNNYANRTGQIFSEGAAVGSGEYWSEVASSNERTNDTLKFQTGTKVFSLRSTPNPLEGDVTTHVESAFIASGAFDTRQYSSVFGIDTIVVETTENQTGARSSTSTTSLGIHETGDVIKYFDPVAQSFVVDSNRYPQGLFVDSIDVWFQTKHNDTAGTQLPVTLEIRPTIAGVPHGGKIIAKKSLLPSQVSISTGVGADIPSPTNGETNFMFDRPVKLDSGKEYAIVLVTDSLDYLVWTAEMGEPQVGTGGTTGVPARTVDAQPHLGSFFKSQNGVTWTPEQNQDLMFQFHKCVFTPQQVGTAIWKSVNAHSTMPPSFARVGDVFNHVNYDAITGGAGAAPIATSHATTTGHKIWQTDFEFDEFRIDTAALDFPETNVTFDYDCTKTTETLVPNVFDLEFDEVDGYQPVDLRTNTIHPRDRMKIMKDKSGAFVLRGSFSTNSTDISPVINLERMGLSMFRNLINDGGLHANTWPYSRVSTDSFTPGVITGGGFVILDSGTGYTTGEAITIAAPAGKSGGGATGTLVANGTGALVGFSLSSTGNTYLSSPTITVGGAGSGASVVYVGETDRVGPGNFNARYATKKVRLEPGFDSKDIRVFLTAASPPGTKIHVYAKVRSDMDDQSFAEKPWQLLARGQDTSSELSSDRGSSKELVFRGTGDDDSFPLAYLSRTDDEEIGEGERYTEFNEFAIKIVLQSADTRIVPIVYDMRAIAVG